MSAFIKIIAEFRASLPIVVNVLLILLAGWLLAVFVRFLLSKLLSLLRFDLMSERTGVSDFLRKGNVRYSPSRLVGVIAYWVLLTVTFFQISKTLDIGVVTELSDQVMKTLPGLFAAVFIAVIGFIVISFLANFTLTIARNAAVPNARLLARSIKYAGNIIVIAVAVDQAGLATSILTSMFQLLFGALVFGIALAFGLGCRDIARDSMQRFIMNLKERERCTRESDLEG